MGGADLEPGEIQLDRDEHRRDRDKDSRKRDSDRHEESSKDHRKSRDKERDKEKDRESRDKERNRDKEKDREHRDNKERSRDKEKDRERNRDKEKDRENRDKEKDRDNRDKEKDRENRDKERNRDNDRENREKEKDKDKVREKERDKEKPREREKERDKEKHRSKDKDGERNREKEKDKPRDRERSTEREKDKEKETSRRTDRKEDEKASELREKIVKKKEERLKEREKEEEDSDVLSFVSKLRKVEEKRKMEREKALKLSQALEEQDKLLAGSDDDSDDEESAAHAKDHLAGMKVLHGLDKVIEGGAVVLTLKDQDILASGDLNEEADMLENVEIGEQKHRDDLYQASKKKTGIYTDKFSDDTGIKKPMLAQYDDPMEDEGVTLDEGGRFTGEAEKKLEELRKRISGVSTQKPALDLTSQSKTSSEYYTQEEMLQFKKPKKKKTKSLRKKEKLDLDALEAEAKESGLGSSDFGSRKDPNRLGKIEEKEKMESESRIGKYKAAIEKAEEETRISRMRETGISDDGNEGNEVLVFGEDYEDLQRSVEQERKRALMMRKEENVLDLKKVVSLATEKKVNNENDMEIDNNDHGDNDGGNSGNSNKVVFSDMDEFVWGLQLKEETQKPETDDVFMDADSPPPQQPQQDETADITAGWSDLTSNSSSQPPPPPSPLKDKEEQKDALAPDDIIHEPSVGKGLSGALKLLKDRGTLNEGIDWGGRTMDKKKSKLVGIVEEPSSKSGGSGVREKEEREIRIERLDEFGRIMTPKEAFRALSHKFHGKGPGKMKQEKRLKKFQEELKAKQMPDSDTPLLSMEKMREAQAKMKSPYLVLSGHVKPGQTSDPRSGFATVEKDVGSLTPMLGDRKVEHFLGIKRSADAGSMPPPPPKKPKN
ncbi:hypothetical protein LUZ60_009041 [Juncus effusus]|nr:hypothetical protein LUZ60_009041 [Juncus effusus]